MNSEDFNDHPIFDKLNNILEMLDSEDFIDSTPLEYKKYFESAISFILQRLKLSIPELISDSELSKSSNELESVFVNIENFIIEKSNIHLEYAKSGLRNPISRASTFPLMLETPEFSFSTEISSFSSKIEREYKKLGEINKTIIQDMVSIKEELQKKNDMVDKLSKSINKKDVEIENLNKEFELEFQKIKDRSISEFNESLVNQKKEFIAQKQELVEDVESIRNGVGNRASEIISDLDEMKQEARILVGLVGETAVTGNYQIIANEHKKSANTWRRIAIICMLLFSAILIYTIFDLNSTDLEWQKALIRVIAALSLSYPATYAARESSKHRNLENINRKAELELAAINPFIELLPTDKKQEIKAGLVERYFGNENSTNSTVDEDMSIASFERILNAISNLKNK